MINNQFKKVERNALCPCGSEKKFKKCHGGPNPPDGQMPGQIDARLKKLAPPKSCFVPDIIRNECSGMPIDSHTVSRSGSLGKISQDSHVYSYRLSQQGLTKSGGKVLPLLTGWRKASTFPGFCAQHDKKLFAPLEDAPFAGSKQQCFLLAYRAITYELYAKYRSSFHSQYRDAITTGNQSVNILANFFNQGVELGLTDSKLHKKYYDDVLISEDWNLVRTELIEFDGIFPIQCAATFFPEYDVHGKLLQNLASSNKKLDALSIISFAADEKSYFCFCWLKDSDTSCDEYVRTLRLVAKESLPIVLASLIFQTSENCHFSPAWYDALPVAGKEWCRTQMMKGLPMSVFLVPPPINSATLPYLSGQSVRLVSAGA